MQVDCSIRHCSELLAELSYITFTFVVHNKKHKDIRNHNFFDYFTGLGTPFHGAAPKRVCPMPHAPCPMGHGANMGLEALLRKATGL
jgi:hypothetical protein